MTSPYWLGWYGPRSRTAIFQIRLALVCAMLVCAMFSVCSPRRSVREVQPIYDL